MALVALATLAKPTMCTVAAPTFQVCVILALAQPAAEGVPPCDAAGIDQAPTGYSSVGSSGAPPSLSPLSPVLPLGCASVFGSGLSVWLRFGWDPGGAVAMRGCEQRSAAACA